MYVKCVGPNREKLFECKHATWEYFSSIEEDQKKIQSVSNIETYYCFTEVGKGPEHTYWWVEMLLTTEDGLVQVLVSSDASVYFMSDEGKTIDRIG